MAAAELAGPLLAALAKALLYGAAIALIAAAVHGDLLGGSDLRARRRARRTALLAAPLLLLLSFVDLAQALRTVLGYVDAELLTAYLGGSLHGRASALRALLALALAATAWRAPLRPRAGGAALRALLALALLATFAAVSHNAAAGRGALLVDLVHLLAAAGWIAAVASVAFLTDWRRAAAEGSTVASGGDPEGDPRARLRRALERVSRIGLLAVAALFASGVYSASLHLAPESGRVLAALGGTRYGLALIAKLTVVAAILAIAAVNRWRFLPALRRGGATPGLGRALRIETALLALTVLLTGWLTTSPVPHL